MNVQCGNVRCLTAPSDEPSQCKHFVLLHKSSYLRHALIGNKELWDR